jgi:hypothetical protein
MLENCEPSVLGVGEAPAINDFNGILVEMDEITVEFLATCRKDLWSIYPF